MSRLSQFASAGLLVSLLGLPVSGAVLQGDMGGAKATAWLTGAELQKQLAHKISITWSALTLRQALASLSQSQRLAVVLDRRVDPDQTVDLTLTDMPLGDALQRIAEREKIGVTMLGPVAYFGPPRTARQLRTLSALRTEETRGLPPAVRQEMLKLKTWRWDELSEPRALISQWAHDAGVEIAGLEQVPHDLWPAADWPLLSAVDRLTLIAAQFDLTFRFESAGKIVRLAPIPEQVVIERSFPIGPRAAENAAKLTRQFPSARIVASGGQIVVLGTIEDIERIQNTWIAAPAQRTSVVEGAKHFQFNAQNASVRTILDRLNQQLGLEIRIDEAAIRTAGLSLDHLVSVDVKGVSLDELLKAVLSPAHLTFRRTGTTVDVMPAK